MIQTPEQHIRKSPYVLASKTKGTSFFPKIQRSEGPSPVKPASKPMGKRNYHESIFKIKGDLPARIKLPAHLPDVDDQKVMQSCHYKELLAEIEQMENQYRQEIAEIDAKKEAINERIIIKKESSYHDKYKLWEIKNQIMELENVLKEEEQQQEQLLYDLGYDEFEQTPDHSDQSLDGESNEEASQFD